LLQVHPLIVVADQLAQRAAVSQPAIGIERTRYAGDAAR